MSDVGQEPHCKLSCDRSKLGLVDIGSLFMEMFVVGLDNSLSVEEFLLGLETDHCLWKCLWLRCAGHGSLFLALPAARKCL